MSHTWDEIKEVIEITENEKVFNELSSLEQQEGIIKRQLTISDRMRGYLEFLGKLSVGVSVGFFTIMFNFLLFVWFLHIEVNPQTGIFGKGSKESLATADHVLPQYNYQDASEHQDEEKSKETKTVLKHASQYVEQAAKWVSQKLKAGTINVIEGFHLITDKLKKVTGWDTVEVRKEIKEKNTVMPKEKISKQKAEAKKGVNAEFQLLRNPSKILYIVQAGVFINFSNADALKARLVKKGYNAYVVFLKPVRNDKLYTICKVWIGEFTNKEKAEKVSMEISKAEGLQTFVTFKK
jgi:cell division protein FtsN